MEIRNVRTRTAEIAATGQRVEPGESVEVDATLGRALLQQPTNWAPVRRKNKSDKSEED